MVYDYSAIWQTAIFDPEGLSGPVYLYVRYTVHRLIYAGMFKAFACSAGKEQRYRLDQQFREALAF